MVSGREEAKKEYAGKKLNLKYGLTIRLDTRELSFEGREEEHSEQVITIENENCEVKNLLEEPEKPFKISPTINTKLTSFIEAYYDIGLLIIARRGQKGYVDLTRTLTSNTFKERVLVIAEQGSELSIIDKHTNTSCTLKASIIEIIAEKDAKVKYASIQSLKDCQDIASYRGKTEQGARIDWFIASLGSKLTHANVDTYLEGEGSESRSYGVFLGSGKQQFDLSASTFHKGNKTSSDMYTRGVLLDSAKAIYRGNIDIDSQAYDCNGYQTEETLLIGEDAVADAIPNLEIRNNQVKCSHGATIGRIDEEQLFYLKSRGIRETQAINMIIQGYFEPITKKLEWTELFSLIEPIVNERIK